MPIPVRGDIAILTADLHTSSDARLHLLVVTIRQGYDEQVAKVIPLATWIACPIELPTSDLTVLHHVQLAEHPDRGPVRGLPVGLPVPVSADLTPVAVQAFTRVCDAASVGSRRRMQRICAAVTTVRQHADALAAASGYRATPEPAVRGWGARGHGGMWKL